MLLNYSTDVRILLIAVEVCGILWNKFEHVTTVNSMNIDRGAPELGSGRLVPAGTPIF
jgi:hypothetical protein